MSRPALITLTTDFGLSDAYVGVMKGVVLTIAPGVQLVDLSHLVPPQDVAAAAFLLRSAVSYFSPDAVHLAVVDPGVGTSRRPIAVQTPQGSFVGPDNGIFAWVLAQQRFMDPTTGALRGVQAVELSAPGYRLPHVSQTFHGRDIFAPAAAHLASGVPVEKLGPRLSRLQTLPQTEPRREDGTVYGSFVYIDHFGNAVSNVPAEAVPSSPLFEVAGQTIRGLAGSYQDAEVVALVGSSGLVEVAARNGSAADLLGITTGDVLLVRAEQ